MRYGRVTRMFPSFGFLTDDADPPCTYGGYFFAGTDAIDFEQLAIGDKVTFAAVKPEPQRGPKAFGVRRL